ncbi:MAG: antitoxin family protein [Blastocatellia bacterium]
MLNTIRAIIKEGKIELLEKIDIPEGTEVLVTPLIDEADFWLIASRPAIDTVWDNEDDNVYAELLACCQFSY